MEAKYQLKKHVDAASGQVITKHCAKAACKLAGTWSYEISIEKTTKGLKVSFPKAIGHVSFMEFFEHLFDSPVIVSFSKASGKTGRYIGTI